MRIKVLTLFVALFATAASLAATTIEPTNNQYNYAMTYYHGWMTDQNILPVLTGRGFHFKYGDTDTVEFSHTLPVNNGLRRFFQSFISTVELAGNITHRGDPNGSIYEFDPYLIFRWQHFSWDNILKNTFAVGEGVSYVTSIPLREQQDSSNKNAKHLLNFLMVEATFALPQHPAWEAVVRVHHRCGAWGLFGAGNLSSNLVGLGVRYSFM